MGRVNLFLFSLCSFSLASAFPLINGEISAGYIRQSPEGWVSYKGDKVDIKDDLKIGDEDSFFLKGKIEHFIPYVPNLYLMFTDMNFHGDGTVKKTFSFGDISVSINDRVVTDLKLDHYDIGFYYNLPFLNRISLGVLDGEAGLYIRVLDFKARVEDKTRHTVDETSATIPLPLLYLNLSLEPFDFLSLNTEAKGVTYDGNYYYDLQGEIRLHPFSLGVTKPFVSLGYRYEKIKFDDIEDTSADIKIKQPFVSAGFLF